MQTEQPRDVMLEFKGDVQQIVYGTSLWRLNEVVDSQPLDQESSEFYAGDIRDVCVVCDVKDKVVSSLRESAKNVLPGTKLTLKVADVRQLIRLVRNPKTETPAS